MNHLTIKDIAEGFERALCAKIGLDQPFDAIVHSTGMLVILVASRVAGAIEGLVELEEVGKLTLKGFLRPVPTCNALGLKPPAS